MSIKRAGLVPLASLLILAGTWGHAAGQQKAGEPAPPPAVGTPVSTSGAAILVVDTQALLESSKAAKDANQQMQKQGTEYYDQLRSELARLEKERDELQRQVPSLSKEALRQKEIAFQQKEDQYQQDKRTKDATLQKAYIDARNKIVRIVNNIIQEIATKRHIGFVLDKRSLAIYPESAEITDAVLQQLDEQLPTLKVDFVPPTQPQAAEPPPARAAAKKKRQ